jgi:hypothetical protein
MATAGLFWLSQHQGRVLQPVLQATGFVAATPYFNSAAR